MRNFHYNDTNVDKSVPPVLDAFQYFAQGDYNRGDKDHTKDVNNAGKKAWSYPQVMEWWNTSDPNAGNNLYNYWFNKTKKELKNK